MTSSASADDSAAPAARRARSAATTVGSIGSECTAISCKAAHRRDALLGAAKIERALQTQAAQHFDIGLGEMAEMVGAEDLPPADGAAISGGIATEVAEIAGAGEIEVAGRDILTWDQLKPSSAAEK